MLDRKCAPALLKLKPWYLLWDNNSVYIKVAAFNQLAFFLFKHKQTFFPQLELEIGIGHMYSFLPFYPIQNHIHHDDSFKKKTTC